jgi:hypothetical protein
LRVKIVLPGKDFGSYLIFLERGARVIQSVPSEVAKQLAQGLRAVKDGAVGKLFDLGLNLRPFHYVTPVTAL